MKIKTLCIAGGTGFLGTQLASRALQEGFAVRVLTRRRESARHLWVMPGLEVIEADILNDKLSEHLDGCDAVVNLVGILNEAGDRGQGFRKAHVDVTQALLDGARAVGARHFIQMSSLGADPEGPSNYLQSKGQAEALALKACDDQLTVSILRPSVIFGPGDSFFNLFAQLLKAIPGIFPLTCPGARFAPVYVGDVVSVMIQCLTTYPLTTKRYDLGGPNVYTLLQLVEYTADVLDLKRTILPLSDRSSKLAAEICEFIPGKPFSRDNYRSTQVDSIPHLVDNLASLGISPTSIEAVVPMYLGTVGERRHHDVLRARAHRRVS